jgi:hypothetical protein
MRKTSSTAQPRQGRGRTAISMRTTALWPRRSGPLGPLERRAGRAVLGPSGVEAAALRSLLLCLAPSTENNNKGSGSLR